MGYFLSGGEISHYANDNYPHAVRLSTFTNRISNRSKHGIIH